MGIRCIRPNEAEASGEFSRSFVTQQVRSLQVLETVNLMAGGLPHRMRFKNFNSRYRLLAPIKNVSRKEELAFEECHQMLELLRAVLEQPLEEASPLSKDWALGKKHVFLSEGTRQHLEQLRTRAHPQQQHTAHAQPQQQQPRPRTTSRPRPQPIPCPPSSPPRRTPAQPPSRHSTWTDA